MLFRSQSLKKEKVKHVFGLIGSAQCKSAVIFAGMRTDGTTFIKAKKSRNHTELMCKYLRLPITVKNKKIY